MPDNSKDAERSESWSAVTRRVQAAYDEIAPLYAQRNAAMPKVYLDLGAQLTSEVGPSERVLDLGCGAGRDMVWLERLGVDVIGADVSKGMLRVARSAADGPLVQLDMRRLPFGTATFRGVWCSASLLHIPKAEAPMVLREVRRVLAPDGMLLLGIQEGEGETWERGRYRDEERFFARYRPDEAEALVLEAGFDVVGRHQGADSARRWLTFLAKMID